MSNRNIVICSAVGGVPLLYCILCLIFGSYQIPPGHKGVVLSYGKVESIEDEGLVVVKFWKTVVKFQVQVQAEEESGYVPTKEGLSCQLDASLTFRVRPEKVVDLYREVGVDYQKKIVERSFQSAIRAVTAKHMAEHLYTGTRDQIEGEILTEARQLLEPYGFVCEQVLMKAVHLPERVRVAIEQKQAAEQDNQRMEYTLKQALKEAERKEIEAKGIAAAQLIIQEKLSDQYIRWAWVQALKEHQGAIIYVPTGYDGLPFFKNIDKNKP